MSRTAAEDDEDNEVQWGKYGTVLVEATLRSNCWIHHLIPVFQTENLRVQNTRHLHTYATQWQMSNAKSLDNLMLEQ